MTRAFPTDSDARTSKVWALTPAEASVAVTKYLDLLRAKWKLEILFQLFDTRVRRYSELERDITGISPKMLTQQLRQLERDGLVERTVHPQVPPRVEYNLTPWGQSLCPVLDALLRWGSQNNPALAAAMPHAERTKRQLQIQE